MRPVLILMALVMTTALVSEAAEEIGEKAEDHRFGGDFPVPSDMVPNKSKAMRVLRAN